ncbi:hypothetical protein [Salinicola tamaricis]|uniref:hypothetical protein n=1 Tax=Salinicola tamaricis TaxID=1771309 RepID=UPI001F5CBA48|nr:hypothetical protein [Salinicola tamaricis]
MDEVTQQNAQRVQTSAASAAELRTSVDSLARSIAVFRLAGSGRERVPGGGQEPRLTSKPAASKRAAPALVSNDKSRTRPASGNDTGEWEAF